MDYSLYIVRIIAALFIFLCHAFSSMGGYGSILGQIFNVGVPIFFLMSGYLMSRKNNISDYKNWYIKRFKTIYIPLWIFLISFLIGNFIYNVPLEIKQVIGTISGLGELKFGWLNGCGHLWFITEIIICYLFTPLIIKLKKLKAYQFIVFSMMYWSVIVGLASTGGYDKYCITLTSVYTFIIGVYVIADIIKKDKKKGYAFIVAVVSMLIRIFTRKSFDGTWIYTYVIVYFTHLLLATSLLYLIYHIGKDFISRYNKEQVKKSIKYIAGITYEFYIVHDIFFTGPFEIKIGSKIISIVIAFVLSAMFSILIHGLANIITARRKAVKK